MAPTSEERREVAARMRTYAHDFKFRGSNPFWYVVKALFGDVDAHDYNSVFARLADLIDPTCHMGPAYAGGFVCDRCYTWLPGMKKMPLYCPHCGARVVSDDGARD